MKKKENVCNEVLSKIAQADSNVYALCEHLVETACFLGNHIAALSKKQAERITVQLEELEDSIKATSVMLDEMSNTLFDICKPEKSKLIEAAWDKLMANKCRVENTDV